ncbi:chemotaxis protein CheW [Modestobacter sp. I12A-02628]|uniref:Chemotaxis protein CheW n=1 Tax=Goekera deserti TaxID=2497753 RepID=A0A7K3WGX4_9ACTN|nr:chemotaxis protein CheW [Goekera deserti]MPQ97837.1 chemotaxis protein CheW [Goekera deserti]NDI48482.1 chemotaxis protein CheW [Goekera deserti]NEL55139.1 chemotaxis protein CheW [Goekera deserti]
MTAGPPDDAADVVYGLLTLAGMDVALPLSALREVVRRPATFTPLPVQAPGLLGAMSLRTLVLPVVDLRPLIGRAEEVREDQVVVVIAHAGRLLGLLADSVRGISPISADALLSMAAAGGQLLFSHTFRHLVTDTPVSVLDAAALVQLPGMPTVADPQRPGTTPAGSVRGRAGTGRSLTLVRCGRQVLAIDVAQVHTTLPLTGVRASILDGPLCLGVTDQAGMEVPVVDPMALLGLQPLAPADIGAGLVLDFGHGLVVLAVSELVELCEVDTDDVLPVPAHAVRRPDLLAGMAELPGRGACLVVDGPALMLDRDLSGFASVNTVLAGPPGPRAGAQRPGTPAAATVPGSGASYVTYSVGTDVATPLTQVIEILPFPETMTPTEVDASVLGVVVHRRAAVPVLCLGTVIGRTPLERTHAACLLLVEVDGEQVAFAVGALRGIDPLAWADPDLARGAPIADLRRALNTSPLVQLGTRTKLLPDLDLREVARAVRGPAEPAACPDPEAASLLVP